jgi:hypothetical protein
MIHIILTVSSGVADKMRIGSQPTSSKLTDKIGEQATWFKAKMNSIQRVTVDTYKTMKFTITKNINR